MLGAGMMGAAIAYVCAKAKIEVVLKDVDQDAADRGKAYSEKLVAKGVERGKVTQEKGDALLARITPTTDPAAAAGADIVIEAVFERSDGQGAGLRGDRAASGAGRDPRLEHLDPADHRAWPSSSADPMTSSGCTSSPPWTRCRCSRSSRARRRETRFSTGLDFAKQIGKTPIVVNDSRGFFTSRVIGTFINEGIGDARRGHPGPVDRAGLIAGRLPGARACSSPTSST